MQSAREKKNDGRGVNYGIKYKDQHYCSLRQRGRERSYLHGLGERGEGNGKDTSGRMEIMKVLGWGIALIVGNKETVVTKISPGEF